MASVHYVHRAWMFEASLRRCGATWTQTFFFTQGVISRTASARAGLHLGITCAALVPHPAPPPPTDLQCISMKPPSAFAVSSRCHR